MPRYFRVVYHQKWPRTIMRARYTPHCSTSGNNARNASLCERQLHYSKPAACAASPFFPSFLATYYTMSREAS